MGFWIGFAAGLDNPPAQNGIEWETLLAGAFAIAGGWMAYYGATAPFRDEQKTKNLKFFMNMRNVADHFWAYFDLGRDGYRVRDPLFITLDSEGNVDETKNEQKRPSRWQIANVRYSIYHMYMMLPDIPSDILTKELYKIRSDFREELQTFLIETKVDNIPVEVLEAVSNERVKGSKDTIDLEDGPIKINELPENVAMSEEEFLEVTEFSQINEDFALFEKLENLAKILTRMRRYMLDHT